MKHNKKVFVLTTGLIALSVGTLKADLFSDPTKFALVTDAAGRIITHETDPNLNDIKETLVKWDECGNSQSTLQGQVTWAYNDNMKTVEWPTDKDDLVPCTKRDVSKEFVEFLNDNFAKCVATGLQKDAQQEVNNSLYRLDSKSDPLEVDRIISTAIGRTNDKASKQISDILKNFKSIEILHQGIIADERHSSRSYHSAFTMRAIDISHIRVTTKDNTSFILQHNVASYAENLEMTKSTQTPTSEQTAQSRFWRTFGACMTAGEGGIISKNLHHTGSGFKHSGHMHISLPYRDIGNYFEKGVDNHGLVFE